MSEDLQQLHRWADGLLVKNSPRQTRTQLAREIARSLRQSQSQRIAAQKNGRLIVRPVSPSYAVKRKDPPPDVP